MTLNRKLLYLGENRGVHDERFIEALGLIFDVKTLFLEESPNGRVTLTEPYDYVVVSPMSKKSLEFSDSLSGIKIGICWAIEVNEITYTEPEMQQIANTLDGFSLIFFDADHVKELIKRTFSFNGLMEKLYFGCDINGFSAIAEARDFTNYNRILVTRNWKALYRNELVLESLREIDNPSTYRATFTSIPFQDSSEIITRMKKHGIEVFFTGVLDSENLLNAYRDHDIYISAARSDGISVSLLEAMACGMICIVTDFPSNLEIIRDGVNGFTFINGNCNSLADAIRRVASLSPSERFQLGVEARNSILQRADWNRNKLLMIERILSLHD